MVSLRSNLAIDESEASAQIWSDIHINSFLFQPAARRHVPGESSAPASNLNLARNLAKDKSPDDVPGASVRSAVVLAGRGADWPELGFRQRLERNQRRRTGL
jgi:hypothetical protein